MILEDAFGIAAIFQAVTWELACTGLIRGFVTVTRESL